MIMPDIGFTDSLVRIARSLESPDRELVLSLADEVARLSAEVERLKSALAIRPVSGPSLMDEEDRKALQRYRWMHRGNSPEHPG